MDTYFVILEFHLQAGFEDAALIVEEADTVGHFRPGDKTAYIQHTDSSDDTIKQEEVSSRFHSFLQFYIFFLQIACLFGKNMYLCKIITTIIIMAIIIFKL